MWIDKRDLEAAPRVGNKPAYRGAAIYRDTLMERAWGGDAETTRAVDTYITRLRKKLNWGDKIETVYQIGYRLKQE